MVSLYLSISMLTQAGNVLHCSTPQQHRGKFTEKDKIKMFQSKQLKLSEFTAMADGKKNVMKKSI